MDSLTIMLNMVKAIETTKLCLSALSDYYGNHHKYGNLFHEEDFARAINDINNNVLMGKMTFEEFSRKHVGLY